MESNNKRRTWGIILLALYAAGCIAVSVWQFSEGVSTLRSMQAAAPAAQAVDTERVGAIASPVAVQSAEQTQAPTLTLETVSPSAAPSPSPDVDSTPSVSPAVNAASASDAPSALPSPEAQCAHEYGAWATVVEATVTSNGMDERVCALCGAVESRITNPKPTIDTSPGNESLQEMFRLINAERAAAGLGEVYYCGDIQAAVDLRAQELNTYYDMQHNRPDGREAVTVFYDLGISYSMLGENFTLGPQSAEQAMAEFMNSDGHRALILSADAAGVALSVAPNDEFGLAWVQIFVK